MAVLLNIVMLLRLGIQKISHYIRTTLTHFNSLAVISWQQPVDDFILLEIYDVLGNEVATLVNENIEAGKHSIYFDASNLSSGMYIYKLQGSSFVQNKKMILIK